MYGMQGFGQTTAPTASPVDQAGIDATAGILLAILANGQSAQVQQSLAQLDPQTKQAVCTSMYTQSGSNSAQQSQVQQVCQAAGASVGGLTTTQYVLIGVGVVAAGGLLYYLAKKKG